MYEYLNIIVLYNNIKCLNRIQRHVCVPKQKTTEKNHTIRTIGTHQLFYYIFIRAKLDVVEYLIYDI